KKFRRPIGSEDLIEAAIEAQKSKSKTILLEDNLGPLKDPVEILREHEPVSQPEPAPPRGGGGQFGGGG
ncbi:MAG: hypothetical protein JO317_07485, partial [Verrucomicrobiae bacterium]|nr:hypothetical protein [Verrucomicrobiae bacterium]